MINQDKPNAVLSWGDNKVELNQSMVDKVCDLFFADARRIEGSQSTMLYCFEKFRDIIHLREAMYAWRPTHEYDFRRGGLFSVPKAVTTQTFDAAAIKELELRSDEMVFNIVLTGVSYRPAGSPVGEVRNVKLSRTDLVCTDSRPQVVSLRHRFDWQIDLDGNAVFVRLQLDLERGSITYETSANVESVDLQAAIWATRPK